MFNQTWSNQNPTDEIVKRTIRFLIFPGTSITFSEKWVIWGAAIFLVSVPVFFEAPLVRHYPWISLALTGVWLAGGWQLTRSPKTWHWGDLLLGFMQTWFTGSVYWGWFSAEPLLHLPIEASLLPLALIGIWRHWSKIGNWFFLGSLIGTAITDLYFYLMGLIPHWRQLMQADPSLAQPIFQNALTLAETPEGITWAVMLVTVLLVLGIVPLRSPHLHHWVFSGAVLSTILVDSLFLVAAWGI